MVQSRPPEGVSAFRQPLFEERRSKVPHIVLWVHCLVFPLQMKTALLPLRLFLRLLRYVYFMVITLRLYPSSLLDVTFVFTVVVLLLLVVDFILFVIVFGTFRRSSVVYLLLLFGAVCLSISGNSCALCFLCSYICVIPFPAFSEQRCRPFRGFVIYTAWTFLPNQ